MRLKSPLHQGGIKEEEPMSRFNWEDPLQLDDQLSAEERQILRHLHRQILRHSKVFHFYKKYFSYSFVLSS
jgi:hypothetical protein